MSLQPTDNRGNSIPVLSLRGNGGKTVAVSSSSARNAAVFTSDVQVITLYSTTDCFIKFGDNTVAATATDDFLPAFFRIDLAVNGATNIAAIRATADGTLYISERA